MRYLCRMKKITLVILVAFVLLFGGIWLLSGPPQKTETNKMLKVKIADLPVVHGLPLYLALEKGYFTEVGIDVERVKFEAPNQLIDAILSGQVDFTSPSGAMGITGIADFKNPGKIKIYAAAGGDLVVSNDSLLVPMDSQISVVEELAGKKLGVLPGIQWRTIATQLLANHGLIAGGDVVLVELAPGLQAPALASGEIDALLATEPMPTIVREKGIGKEIIHAAAAQEIASPFYGGGGAVSVKFATEYPEETAKIFAVFERAINEIRADPVAARQYFKGYTPLDDVLIAQAPILNFKMFHELKEIDLDAIQAFYDIFTAQGVVDGSMDIRSLLY